MDKTQELARKQKLSELIAAWDSACADIRDSSATLKRAENTLRDAFGGERSFYLFSTQELHDFNDPDRYISRVQRTAWRNLVEMMEIRRFLSMARQKEWDSKIENGELPPITFETVAGMMQSTHGNINNFMQETVKEVHELLRPHRSHLKTNTEFDIGKKVILEWMVETYGGGAFHINYRRSDSFTAIEGVFKMLAGDGVIKTHQSDLEMSINKCKGGKGETDYFIFKCYQNSNLHLEFKRMDLVKKLNAIAGGNALYPGE